jgi:hypothetical protein
MNMLTDLDIYWQKEWHPFEHKDHDRTEYAVYAIVIDNEIVDVCAYKKSFIDMYNSHKFVEIDFVDGKYTIDVLSDDNFVVAQLELSERVGSIFLSEPITVRVNDQTSYASVGMKHINGEIVRL